MNALEELQKKVLQVVDRNKQLEAKVDRLSEENANLSKQKEQLEASLLNENASLSKEKDKVKLSIESLLESISSLEKHS